MTQIGKILSRRTRETNWYGLIVQYYRYVNGICDPLPHIAFELLGHAT